ncbi:glycosyltransferase 87 family protein [Duganella sp. HH101]|uniref:glycosyltransferase 87 family protein n=1 Tax=Duganella sp. HH101 TaxID=1781066 RepID=UPI000893C8D7|nr:glycosyltransferase 87 family protein [Duganella sp. HH101]OFA02585.1 hypothetical protein DUGA2_34350 [Duganella sp. HH101]
MIKLSRLLTALAAVMARCLTLLETRPWLLPPLFGVLSLLLGQDDNWDLRNYHLYNPFALLNGKLNVDLAPGQWQSYFNPTLDLVYYGLLRALPAPLAGFAMGALHGLNALLVLAIARRLLAHLPQAGAQRLPLSLPLSVPLLLALAGCMGCAFFSQLGNSMGDNLTALCVLGALALALRHWEALARAGGRGLALALLAGLVMGAGTGLKLTNATYALALCAALLMLPGGWWRAVSRAFVFGAGVLSGIALTAGHWFWRMWLEFGNPLYPQFNDIFRSPLAAPIGIGDTHWLPQGWTEKLLWPVIFALHPERVTEIRMRLLLWPLLYLGFIVLAVAALRAWRRPRIAGQAGLPPQARFVLAFFVLAYLGWQALFSIYRYLVPLELLAPLVLWLLAHRLLAPPAARRVAGGAVLLAVLLALPTPHWGRARWSSEAFRVSVPELAHPEQSLVLTTQAPVGWYTAGFPASLAFVSISGGFPGSALYDQRVAAMMAERSGPFYVLLTSIQQDPAEKPRAERRRQGDAADSAVRSDAAAILGRHGLRLDSASGCRVYPAYIGRNYLPYQFCAVVRK